ncbi:iron ABC transporter permease [uncultured Ramlibacter sp.]|uniref:ABC transporter permease n=1 Tax=uncultured Ramlibacter sp. TaxID=260755 RepID=UPI0026050867|nr:iron ABC transporter permease [uncultured Ramlibacter sp.]
MSGLRLRVANPFWLLASAALALVVLAPVASLAWLASGSSLAHWSELASHVLPRAALNTAVLLAGVGVLVTLIGAGCAWLVTAYDFPGRRVFDWALLLPLAMPTYIVAFAYLDLLHPLGPVQSALRWMLGLDSPRQLRLGDLRSMGGAIFLLGSVLYPYVYLTARVMFMTQPAHLLEAARTLGAGPMGAFLRVVVPLARPALAVGLSLALLETLNDIGASEFLGVNTLTVAIYTTWVTRSDLAGAAQLAMLMLLSVLGLLLLERRGRARQRFASMQRMRPIQPRRLAGWAALTATLAVAAPVAVGFAIPALYLATEAVKRVARTGISPALAGAALNTLLVAALVTLAAVAAGLVMAWTTRPSVTAPSVRRLWRTALARSASVGYAVPGTVLAVGLLAPALALDYALGDLLGHKKLLLLGSGAVLVAACTIRFVAIPLGAVEGALLRLPPALEQAARLLGESANRTLVRVHLPLLRPALGAGAMLVFADAMKELPATLLLRPVNFETLATLLYAEAARGTYEEGAVAALAIVATGLVPVALLARAQLRPGH